MGSERRRLEVYGTVERHNSAGDKLDDAAWDHFRECLERLISRPEYVRLRLDVV